MAFALLWQEDLQAGVRMPAVLLRVLALVAGFFCWQLVWRLVWRCGKAQNAALIEVVGSSTSAAKQTRTPLLSLISCLPLPQGFVADGTLDRLCVAFSRAQVRRGM